MAAATMNTEQARFNMIQQQIRPWEVLDPEVLGLLAIVKREDFAPAAHKDLAFADVEVPLKKDAKPSQTMLAPRIETLTCFSGTASTALRVTSLPVPEVVGMAIRGALGWLGDLPLPTTSR